MLKQFETVLVVLMLLPLVVGKLQYMGIDSKIIGNTVTVKITVFKPGENFTLGTLNPIENLTSNTNCRLKDDQIVCTHINVSKSLNLEFISSAVSKLDGLNKFYQQLTLLEDVKRVTCIVTLPVGSILANRSDVVYPNNYKTLSNGRNILVYWEIANVSSSQPLSFQVYYQSTATGLPISTTIKILVIVIGAIVIFTVSLAKERRKKTEEMILEVLDEYEKCIFDIVKEHGRIKQRKLVELTGFSKARVSRVVRSLMKRKLVTAERRGRNNIVRLRKKKAKISFS